MKGKTVILTVNNVQSELYLLLKSKGLDAEFLKKISGPDSLRGFDNIILPFPSREEGFDFLPQGCRLGELVKENQLVTGGMLSDKLKKEIENAGAKYEDYFENEAYVLKNAFITGQGALKLLLDTSNDYIVGKKALITGFGRIGKALSRMLRGLGVKVFVAARSEAARAEAAACGYEVLSINKLTGALFYFDYIFNTVPQKIFNESDVRHIRADALYFELASRPFGADEKDFIRHERKFISAGALPGRYFPSAVAKNIADFILKRGGD